MNPSYTGYLDAAFLLDSDIMYEVVCFGLADPNNKVCIYFVILAWKAILAFLI